MQKIISKYLILAISLGGLSVLAQDMAIRENSNATLIGRWANGPCQSVVVNGNYAYFGNGGYLEIADVSDPANPVKISQILVPGIEDLTYLNDYLFIASGDAGLRIIDVTTPSDPQEVGLYDTDNHAHSVAVSSNYAYVADGEDGLLIIDVSTPSDLMQVGTYNSGIFAVGVAVSGNYAYAIDEYSGGISIIDVSIPSNPQLVGSCTTNDAAHDVTVGGNYAYIAQLNGGLGIIDVSTPATPEVVGIYSTNWYNPTSSIAINNNLAYLSNGLNGLRIIDVSTPSAPVEVGFYNSDGNAMGIAAGSNYAYLADDYNGLVIIDISSPSDPQEASTYITGDIAYNVTVNDNCAYVAEGLAGLRIIDISTPSEPNELGFYDTEGKAYSVAVSDDYAFVADGSDGMRVIDVSNPSVPEEVGAYDTGGEARGIAVNGNYVYVADLTGGLRVIDVSTPSDPQEVGSYDTNGNAVDIAVSGNYAYIADGTAGLRIIDVSTPSDPQEVGYYTRSWAFLYVAVSGNHAFVTEQNGLLRKIDVSIPSNPQDVGSSWMGMGTYAKGVAVSGNYAYVADYNSGLRIFDVGGTGDPQGVGSYDTDGNPMNIAVSGRYAFVADGKDGLYIIQNDLLIPPVLLSVDTISAASLLDTISIAVNCDIPLEFSCSSVELTFSGFQGAMSSLGIDTTGSMLGATGWDIYIDNPGVLTITASGAANEISGSGRLFSLKFVIPDTAPPGFVPIIIENAVLGESVSNIEIQNGGVNILPIVYGDVSYNGIVQANDASMVLKYLVGTQNFNNQQLLNANVSMDTVVSALDATLIFQYAFGLLDTLPIDGSQETFLASGEIGLDDTEAETGFMVDIPIHLSNGGNIFAFEGTISYDPDILTANTTFITWSELLSGFSIETDTAAGQIKAAGANANPDEIAGIFATLHFQVSENFAENQTTDVTIESLKFNDNLEFTDMTATITIGMTGIESDNSLPDSYTLLPNYPNPFNPRTTMRYGLPEDSNVSLVIYDVRGQVVKTLESGHQSAGWYDVVWNGQTADGRTISTGIYFGRLVAGDYSQVIKMLYLK